MTLGKARIFSIAAVIIAAVLAFLYLQKNPYDFKGLTFQVFLVLSIFSWISAILNGIRVKIFCDIFNIGLSFKEWFGLSQVTSMGNYLTPFKGGTSLRAIYLKKHYDFPYNQFIATMASTAVISFAVYGLLGLISLIFIFAATNTFNSLLFAIFSICTFGSLVIFIFPHSIITRLFTRGFLAGYIAKILEGWSIIKNKPSGIIKLIAIEVLFSAAFAFSIFFAFRAVGFRLPFIYCMIVAVISNISIIFQITPAGLGVREAVTVWASSLFGAGIALPLNVALLVRLVAFIWVVPFGMIYGFMLLGKKRQ
ncbi:MAG TPA: lysylphosphatidylglycerol synthase transmembrane domain-containing protein [Candidatus Nanoarchaeia archaeon]|nr:lysylphosphatidylglycerol synthase transmembrane domain-containing protein [Candidatus Nanoarchaeia archaeon]